MPIGGESERRAQIRKAGPVGAIAKGPGATGTRVDVNVAAEVDGGPLGDVGSRGSPARARRPPRRVHRDAVHHAHLEGAAVVQDADPRRLVAEEGEAGSVAVGHVRRVEDDRRGRDRAVDPMRERVSGGVQVVGDCGGIER